MYRIILILVMISSCLIALANDRDNEPRPITATYAVHFGYGSVLDSYLSPLRYEGENIGIECSWEKSIPANPQKLFMTIDAGIETNIAQATSGNNIYNLGLDFGWNLQHRWSITPSFQLGAGAGACMNIGAIYLPGNGNNPASARASADITLNASATWQTNIGKLPIRAIERVSLPSLGVFFSPEFGESYYEIYLGNQSGLAHLGWWGNHFRIKNLLAADLKLGKHSLRVGYELNINDSYVCNINTQLVSHSVLIGITIN